MDPQPKCYIPSTNVTSLLVLTLKFLKRFHHPIENVSVLPVVLPVVYQWKSVVKFGGITTGKTVDFSGKTLVIPVISIVITVENSGNTTKFYH